jgi:hypothetical protein
MDTIFLYFLIFIILFIIIMIINSYYKRLQLVKITKKEIEKVYD